MQQSVLLTAVRGPDNTEKYHTVKFLLRWYRRCILHSAFAGKVITNPWEEDGGSFTGTSYKYTGRGYHDWEVEMNKILHDYVKTLDVLPYHFQVHFMHCAEILGYKHPDERIAAWWYDVYQRLVEDMHLWPETKEQMESRLGDTLDGWLKRSDPATVA